MDVLPPAPPTIGLGALFVKFLRFGCLAFGGPVAQIAMVREALIEDERWISRERFNRLLAVMQVLPGPEAHELCVHLGMIARGRIGGLLAGLGFMIPGFVLMMICGWAYASFIAGQPDWVGVLLGVQAAVLAIILRAVYRIGEHVLASSALIGAALVALAGTLLGVPFWIVLLGAALAFAFFERSGIVIGVLIVSTGIGWLVAGSLPFASFVPAEPKAVTDAATVAALFVAGLKGGLLTFGGAYTAIPYVRDDTVGRGWISDGAFLDGVALAGLLPAPLVIFATFVGYIAGGWPGAIAVTLGMFLPAFAFSMIFFERLEAIVGNEQQRMLDGVAAAVVGIIAGTFFDLAGSLSERATNLPVIAAIFVIALAAAWKLKGAWVVPLIVAAGAATGLALLG
ncbi:MAG: chromate efflux transporter [Pseudomonadota bacterium]|nr:chromate efflux transporter [Pseudomonadota bacterium]